MRSAWLVAIVAVFIGAGASNAWAAVTQTSISAPTDPSYLVWNASANTNVTVTGTAPGATDGDQVDVNCYYENGSGTVTDNSLATGVTVQNDAFTTTASLFALTDNTCRLRAVPAGTTPTDLTPFAGPAVAVSELEDANFDDGGAAGSSTSYQIVGGPNSGKLYDYYMWQAQLSGAMDYDSLGSCGPCDSYAIDPSTFRVPDNPLWYSNAALYANLDDGPGIPDRSYVRIDGANAYDSTGAEGLYDRSTPTTYDGSEDAAHFPVLSFSETPDPTTGNLTIHEGEDLVRCATPAGTPDPAPGSTNSTNCPDFASTGVHLNRTIVQNQGGRLVTVTDNFTSTDGASHKLDLLSFQSINSSPAGSLDFPWWDSGLTTYSNGSFVPGAPAGAPVQIYGAGNPAAADGDESVLRGAITLSAPPSGVFFEASGGSSFDLAYRATVPAGGSWMTTQAFSTAFTNAGVTTLATGAAAAMMPSIAIGAPKSGATVTSEPATVSGTVTAGGNGRPSSVVVNGVSTPVNSSGGFSTKVPLAPGANTITASAIDTGGLTAGATAHVTYAAPPPSSSARIKKISAKGKDLLVTIACSSATCTGNAGAVAKLTKVTGKGKHRHRTTSQMTVASGKLSVPAAATKTISLKLSSATRRALSAHKRLSGVLTLTLKEPSGARSSLTRTFKLG